MAIVTGQLSYDNTNPTGLCTVPAGVCSVILSNVGPATVAVGPSSPRTSPLCSTGYLLAPGAAPTSFVTTPASRGGALSCCVTSNGQPATVSFLIST
jgi:hypothetical protein